MGCILVVPFCSMCTSVVEPVHVTASCVVHSDLSADENSRALDGLTY
jgi:hypothetical protein